MPPKGKKKAADALRAAAGVTNDTLAKASGDLGDKGPVWAEGTEKLVSRVGDNLEEFQRWLQDNAQSTLFDDVEILDYFTPASPPVTYELVKSYLVYRAGVILGRKRDDGTTVSRTMFNNFSALCLYCRKTTGKGMDVFVMAQVRAWLRTDMLADKTLNIVQDDTPAAWMADEDFRDLHFALLDLRLGLRTPAIRLQFLSWSAIHKSTALRAGSLLGTRGMKEKKSIQWKDIELAILKNESGGNNHLALRLITPNSKTEASANIEISLSETGDLWFDPVFLTLVLAQHVGAMPSGWTYDQLVDPAVFSNTSDTYLKLKFSQGDEFVYKASRGDSEWVVQTFARYMVQLSDFMGYEKVLHTHCWRYSGAITLKKKDVSFQQIARQLRHAWASSTYMIYCGRLISADATAAVHGGPSNIAASYAVHPDRVKRDFRLSPKTLPARVYQLIFADEYVASLVEETESIKADILASHGVDKVSQLPEDAVKPIRAAWGKFAQAIRHCQRFYRTIIAKNRLFVNGKLDYAGLAQAVAKTPLDAQNQDEGEVEEDGAGGNENDRDGDWAGDLSVQTDDSTDVVRPDELEDGSVVEYEALAYEDFLTSNDTTSAQQALDVALTEGLISRDVYVQAITTNVEVDDMIPIDPVLLALDAEREAGRQLPPLDLSSTHVQPSGSNALSDHAQLDTPSVGPSAGSSSGSAQAGAGSSDGDSHPIDFDQSSLAYARQCLFSDVINRSETFEAFAAIPTGDFLSFGLRPNHAPVDNICVFCKQDIDSVVQYKKGTKYENTARYEGIMAHVDNCAAEQALLKDAPALLANYPSTIDFDPIRGVKSKAKTGVFSLFNLSSKVSECFGPNNLDQPYLQCAACKEQDVDMEIRSSDSYQAHLLQHGILLPKSAPTGAVRELRKTGEWSLKTAVLPHPVYFTHDQAYHTDPREAEDFARQIIEERVFQACKDVEAYGVRDDIEIGDRVNEDFNDFPPDTKYARFRGRFGSTLRDGLCPLCSNDPALSWRSRALPLTAKNLKFHAKSCTLSYLAEVMAIKDGIATGDQVTLRHTYLWCDGQLVCPDSICRRNGRFFETMLEFVHHLAAVHVYCGNGPERDYGGYAKGVLDTTAWTLSGITWATEEELRDAVKAHRSLQSIPLKNVVAEKIAAGKKRKAESHQKRRAKKRGQIDQTEASGSGTNEGAAQHGDEEGNSEEEEDDD